MFSKFGAVVLTSVALAFLSGCGMEMRVVAHSTETNKQWFGDMGITGHLNKVTVATGSRVQKLSIAGDGNTVFVEDNVTLSKVEIFGENNHISVPERLIIRDSIFGKGNVIERRPRVIDAARPTRTRIMSLPENQVQPDATETPADQNPSNAQPSSGDGTAPNSPAPAGDDSGE